MRHQKNRLLELNTWIKKKEVFIKTQLSSLIKNGKLTTTSKRAKVLKAHADAFFSKLLQTSQNYKDEKDAKRECIRLVKTMVAGEDTGKMVIATLLPKYQASKQQSFVADYKVGYRVWDASAKIMLKLL